MRWNHMRLVCFLAICMVGFVLANATLAFADSCSDIVPGAQQTPSPNWLSNPYPGACYVDWSASGYAERQVLAAKCKDVSGYLHFEPDAGSGRNTCIFKAAEENAETPSPTPSPTPESSERTCPSGQKMCEGTCIPDNASCCANGRGVYCPTRGQCCFNPSNAQARNGYVCCGAGQQCVFAEGPTSGVCVAPGENKATPVPTPTPNTQQTPNTLQRYRASRYASNTGLPASTFQRSCTGIRLVMVGNVPGIEADCRRINQTISRTRVALWGIVNLDGELAQATEPASFHLTCRKIRLFLDSGKVILSAQCRRVNGEWVGNELPINGIENIDGGLKY